MEGLDWLYRCCVLGCALVGWLAVPQAMAWGPVGHAVIAELAESALQSDDPALRELLTRWRQKPHRRKVRKALYLRKAHTWPQPGRALRFFAGWPDVHKRRRGMLPYDAQRHYVNLPPQARYDRVRHCPKGRCSIETLLTQRAILADPQVSHAKRAVALAWVVHLVGDMHQPLHAGKAEDRGGNTVCVAWMGKPSVPALMKGQRRCSGANLHQVWDSKLISAATGFNRRADASRLAEQLQADFVRLTASEPPFTARSKADWRAVVERWHAETQALIGQRDIYPTTAAIGHHYTQQHYPTVRLQLLRAAVRLEAMLRQSLNPR